MGSLASDTFSTFGVGVLCIVLSIMALSLFYKAIAWLTRTEPEGITFSVRGVLKKDGLVTIHTSYSEVFEQVRIVGAITHNDTTKIPYEIVGMVILEDVKKVRFIIKPSDIRKIVIEPENVSSSVT
jgi:hypothetical protein